MFAFIGVKLICFWSNDTAEKFIKVTGSKCNASMLDTEASINNKQLNELKLTVEQIRSYEQRLRKHFATIQRKSGKAL